MKPMILNKTDLPLSGSDRDFEGYLYGNVDVSFIWVDLSPGSGPKLHKHPYAEILIIQEGQGTYTVGDSVIRAEAGQVLIVPAEMPHKFISSGEGQLRQIDIHLNKQFVTEWLQDNAAHP